MWIDSPGHHTNIISNTQHSAVAAFYSETKNAYYFT